MQEAVINSHPGAAPAEQGGRMAVDNCGQRHYLMPKWGAILNADGGKLVTINIGKMEFAAFGKMSCKKQVETTGGFFRLVPSVPSAYFDVFFTVCTTK